MNIAGSLLTGVFAVIIRRKGDGLEILTQTRDCRQKPEDMIYHKTEECVGERTLFTQGPVFAGIENVLDTASRGIQEETKGIRDQFVILGANGRSVGALVTSTGRGDKMMVVDPYTFFQALEGCRPRYAPCFLAGVTRSYIPQLDDAGEVSGFQWWEPRQLLVALRATPEKFSYAHPVLLKLCLDIIENGLRPDF